MIYIYFFLSIVLQFILGQESINYNRISITKIIQIKENVFLYIGNNESASDIKTLEQENITFVLNVARNLDIDYEKNLYSHKHQFPVQYAKVGLIDGVGNRKETINAAVSMLDQFVEWALMNENTNNRNNILIHCRHGRSRSPIVTALFLNKNYPNDFPTFDDTWSYIKTKRAQIHLNDHLMNSLK